MKVQQLISAGFAITAFAAATVPTVGWTLLGTVERPPVSAQASWEAPALFEAPAHPMTVAFRFASERGDPMDRRASDPQAGAPR